MRCLLIVAAVLAAAAPAAAQGNGNAYGRVKNPRPSAAGTGSSPAGPSGAGTAEIPGTGVRNFGSWLDDATVMPEGKGALSIGFGLWRLPGYREMDFPTIDGGVGVNRRLQFGVSVPYFYANEPGGPTARGFGNTYLSAKIQLRDPAEHLLGFSVTPIVEMLSVAPPSGGRVGWAIPLNLELQRTGWRAYGSMGYFSRGALFGSSAVEKALSERVSVSGTFSYSHSIDVDPLSEALGLSATRVDVSGGTAVWMTDRIAVFGALGRTISRQDPNSTELVLSGGVSFTFDVH